jgi:prepilin-type N-terminal cleavage/methylation domain-containing protein
MKQRAFTLVEMLVVMLIFSFALGAMYSVYFSGNDLWQVNAEQTDLRQRARIAMGRMCDELKAATRTSALNPSPNLQILSANELHFYLPEDADGNGTPTDAWGNAEWDTNDQIKYQYIPGQRELRRLQKGDSVIIARNVSSVRFTDASADPALGITELKIDLALDEKTARGRTVSCAMSARVKLRN